MSNDSRIIMPAVKSQPQPQPQPQQRPVAEISAIFKHEVDVQMINVAAALSSSKTKLLEVAAVVKKLREGVYYSAKALDQVILVGVSVDREAFAGEDEVAVLDETLLSLLSIVKRIAEVE